MWNNGNVQAIVLAFAAVCNSQHMEYTMAASDLLNYYDYPTPHGLRLQYLQDQPLQQQQYENHHEYHHSSPSLSIAREFESPDLDNAAFTMALTRQGYIIVDGGSPTEIAPPSAALMTKAARTQTSFTPIAVPMHPQPRTPTFPRPEVHSHPHPRPHPQPQPRTHTKSISPPTTRSNSQNVKLPLPLGATPITFAPLPLSSQRSGPPYSTFRGITSYGTPYGQRRRR